MNWYFSSRIQRPEAPPGKPGWRLCCLLPALLLLGSCSSWQEDDRSRYQASPERTSHSRTPVAFQGTQQQQQPARGRTADERIPRADSEWDQTRWYATPGSRRFGQPRDPEPASVWAQEAAPAFEARTTDRSVMGDPLERQFSQMRRSATEAPGARWRNPAEAWRDTGAPRRETGWDPPIGERRGWTIPGESWDERIPREPRAAAAVPGRRAEPTGFSLDFEALAPGSRLAEEQRQREEDRLRREEQGRLRRDAPQTAESRRIEETIGVDLPRPRQIESSGTIESLRQIASREIVREAPPPTARERGTGAVTPEVSQYRRQVRQSLAQILNRADPISLRSTFARTSIPIRISPRLRVDDWSLRLEYSHSTAIVPRQSQMVVSLNKVVVAQIELVPDQPFNTVEIPLPRDLARGREHLIEIAVSQPIANELSAFAMGQERFTQISVTQSYLEVRGHLEPINPRFSELSNLFNYRMIGDAYPIHFCIPGSSTMEQEYLVWGSAVAQGVGLRLEDTPLRLSHGERLRSNQDNILIGEISSIAPFIDADLARRVDGPFMSVQPLYRDDRYFLIVLGGRNAAEVRQAVEAFAAMQSALPNVSFIGIEERGQPSGLVFVGNPPVRIPGTYTFGQLGGRNRTLEDFPSAEYRISIPLPGDFLPARDRSAMLQLNFSHSAFEGQVASLDVFVEELFINSIALTPSADSAHRQHAFPLPPQALRPGSNEIRLVYRVDLEASRGGMRRPAPLTILDSSQIILPASQGTREMPDLSLLARSGFPLTDIETSRDLTVFITDGDPRSIDATWTFLAKVAQVSRSFLQGINLTFLPPESPRNVLVVGLMQQMTDPAAAGSPLFAVGGGIDMTYSRRTGVESAPTRTWYDGLRERFDGEQPVQEVPRELRFRLGVEQDLADDLILAQYENPVRRGFVVTKLAAGSPGALYDGVFRLQQPGVWNTMSGSRMILGGGPGAAPAFTPSVARFPYRGEFEIQQAVVLHIFGDTWMQVVLIIGGLTFLVIVTLVWIRKTSMNHEYELEPGKEEDL